MESEHSGEFVPCSICGRSMPVAEMEHATRDGKTLICQEDESCEAAQSGRNKHHA
jgi:hypothetical protein